MSTPDNNKAVPVLKNGLDFEPKKTYPPDYSNVPDVRSWQMSPFSKERFDLNEIQIAKKKGIKYQAEYEALKKKYGFDGGEKPSGCAPSPPLPKCPRCAEREEAERRNSFGGRRCNILGASSYIPYGPTPRVERSRTRRQSSGIFGGIHVRGASDYIPYGPTPKKFVDIGYEPMGPIFKL